MSLLGVAAKGVVTTAAPWVELVKPFWPLLWRLAVVAAIFAVGHHYGSRAGAQEAAQAQQELQEFRVAQASATSVAVAELRARIAEQDATIKVQEVTGGKILQDLRRDLAERPARVVRVCPDAASPQVPGVPGTAGVVPADAGGAAAVYGGAGRDIGPGLDQYNQRAEVVRTKCILTQAWADALHALNPPP